MTSNLSDFVGSAKPKLITRVTATGAGTYVPTVDMARCRIRAQAGGGGGFTTNAAGGGGAFLEFDVRVPIAGTAYSVGVGGNAGASATAGGATSFGTVIANGGGAGITGSVPGLGGYIGEGYGSVQGVPGGGGGNGSLSGSQAGFPLNSVTNPTSPTLTAVSNGVGNNSGGSSFTGLGGATGVAGAANTGAGGGANAAGGSGVLEIWDYGA